MAERAEEYPWSSARFYLANERALIPLSDARELLASFDKVRGLKARLPRLEIAASHDFAAQEAIDRATGRAT